MIEDTSEELPYDHLVDFERVKPVVKKHRIKLKKEKKRGKSRDSHLPVQVDEQEDRQREPL